MPNRYLRGTGARNWNDTANWSDVSGGAGGASVPTAADNVIFDANSGTGTITVNAIANMLDFTCSNIGALTLSNAAYAFNVYGSLTLHTNLTVTFTSTGYLYMKATDSRTITTNGKVANWNRMYFDGVGGTWTNQDDMVGSANVYLVNGIWNTNSKNITIVNTFSIENGIKTLTLGSSLFKVGTWAESFDFNVFNYNTSTVEITKNGQIFTYTGRTFYNLTITGSQSILPTIVTSITVSNNLVVNGYNSSNYRLLIASNTIGTNRTITCNGTITASNVDFRDITLAGTANRDLSAITGGSGDCGGNSGITFTTAQPQYFKKYAATANYGDAANWFSDLALTVAGRVPLPQDLGSKFLATSFNQTCTVSCNVPRIPCLDMSEVVNIVTLSYNTILECYGSYLLSNSIQPQGTGFLFLMGRNATFYFRNSINIGMYDYYDININSVNGTYVIQNHIKLFRSFNVTSGIFKLNGYNLTCGDASTANGDISFGAGSSSYLGNGAITLHRSISADSMGCSPTANIYSEGSTIILNPASGANNPRFNGQGKSYNKIQFSGSHTGNFDINGSNTIAELIIDSGRKVRFTAGTTQTIGKITYGSGITQDCVTAGTYNLALTEIATAENANIKGCVVTQDSKLFAEANSVDSGSNNRVVFGDYFTVQEIIL